MVTKEIEGNKYQFDSKELDKLMYVILAIHSLEENFTFNKIISHELYLQIKNMIDGKGFDSNYFISRILEYAKKLNKEFFSNDNCYR